MDSPRSIPTQKEPGRAAPRSPSGLRWARLLLNPSFMITAEEAARRLLECELALRTAQQSGSPNEYCAARSAYEAAEQLVLELIRLQAQPYASA